MSRTRRITALALAILAFFIFVGSPFGQSAKAVVGIDDALIAVIIAALAAIGITFTALSGYGTVEEYVKQMITDYCTANNTTPANLFRGVDYGSSRVGKILMNNRFVQVIQALGSYIVSRYSLVNNSIVTAVAPGTALGDMTAYQLPIVIRFPNSGPAQAETAEYSVIWSSEAVSALFVQTTYNTLAVYFLSNEQAQVSEIGIKDGNTVYSYERNVIQRNGSVLYYGFGLYSFGLDVDIGGRTVYSEQDLVNALNRGDTLETTGDGIYINTGTIELPYDDQDYTEGDGAVLDTGAMWGEGVSDITETTIPIAQEDGTITDTTIDYTGEGEIEDKVTDTPSQTISQEVNDYQSPGLPDVFPFCIPFDIYAFFECLAADPVAPSFTWRFYVPGICDEEIEIDLSDFDSVAQIVRTMELLAFIVGLALVTRNRFLRG